MSAPSGIVVSDDLSNAFGHAVDSESVRFLKITIVNESLVLQDSIPIEGSLEEDLRKLDTVLEDDVPAYILAKLDEPGWLAVFYVPDKAKVRDKMLYASTRNNLTKSLGSAHFADNIFATSKDDITADAYKKHLAHLNAPKPMSEREKDIEAVKAAEREVGGAHYEGSRARRNPLGGQAIGFAWEADAENALKELGETDDCRVVVLSVDSHENLTLHSVLTDTSAEAVGKSLPQSDPAYAFFSWPHNITSPPRREIVFIYSCPSSSPIKHRMVYSTALISTYRGGKAILDDAGQFLAERKIETSEPNELNEEFFKLGLKLTASNSPAGPDTASPLAADEDKKAFARPKGPGRKR